jgi:hypothetical protein
MNETCTKMILLESKNKFKTLRLLQQFYEPQMKIGKPIYFSPNFYHRLFIDPLSKQVVLNFTLTNQNIFTMDIRKHLLFQIPKTHPMIYFHSNDKIVYQTEYGVEKMFLIKKTLSNKRR